MTMDDLRDAVARITIEGTAVRGTGFLVAPGIVATALHVVADRKTQPPTFFPGPITLAFRGHTTSAVVIPNGWNQNADCVLLQCVDPKPLAKYPTIPLRALDHADDPWKTFGYPDAQPIDGMIWAGQIRSYCAGLTNYYATTTSPYQPVLQLFCEEAGAGTGAPPRGFSGAPVVVGSAAVGLMRFALMQGNNAVAGTLYACTANDIMTLCPQQLTLRPPLSPVDTLTPSLTAELIQLLSKAFSDRPDDFRRVARFSLGVTS